MSSFADLLKQGFDAAPTVKLPRALRSKAARQEKPTPAEPSKPSNRVLPVLAYPAEPEEIEKPLEPNQRQDIQMAAESQPKPPRPTTDTEVRQAVQEAMNVAMRWERLQDTSVQYRSQEKWTELTKFFRKAFHEVWVDGLGQPLMLPEDAAVIMLATAVSLIGMDVLPDKVKAMESAVRKGRR